MIVIKLPIGEALAMATEDQKQQTAVHISRERRVPQELHIVVLAPGAGRGDRKREPPPKDQRLQANDEYPKLQSWVGVVRREEIGGSATLRRNR